MKRVSAIIIFCSAVCMVSGQDNCFRFPTKYIPVIQNPSFEIDPANCTSGYIDQLGLNVPNWTIPNDEILTGYLNACTGFLVPDSTLAASEKLSRFVFQYPQVPQPIPDGNGVVAVSDFGYNGERRVYAQHKSYVSTCLTASLKKDSLYEIRFMVGFGLRSKDVKQVDTLTLFPEVSPSPEKFTVFGSKTCPDHPQPIIGCPEVAGWANLGSVMVNGNAGSWVSAYIQFKAPYDMQGISLGPSCDTINDSPIDTFRYGNTVVRANRYSYFLDEVEMFQAAVANPSVGIASGSVCDKAVVLGMEPAAFYAGSSIQWLRNGVLLPNENNSSLMVNTGQYGEGSYQCRVQNDTVCLISDPFQLSWKNKPPPDALGSADTTACFGDSLALLAPVDSTFTYTWQDGSHGSSFNVSQSGTYAVSISNDCVTVLAQKNVEYKKCNFGVYVPNAFSPNGNGKNDVFKVAWFYPPADFRFRVFNRQGLLLFYTSDPGQGWNGTFNGVQQPTGVYVWMMSYTDHDGIRHEDKGTVILVR